jgi:hypothetical protein
MALCEKPLRRMLGALFAAAVYGFLTFPASAAEAVDACRPSDGLSYVCGPIASEDLVRVPASRWLIASGMNVGAPAHLYLIDSRRKRATITVASSAPPHSVSASGCGGPPDPRRMSLDGLALRPGAHGLHTLYAANHGDRMAIEIFSIDARGARPRLQWLDCARLPEKTLPNAVAALPGGGFLVISFYDPTDPQAWSRMARGQMTGRILQWQPGQGFAEVPHSATSGGNGLETSADGSLVYASSWSARRLVVLSLRAGTRREIALDFMPDNIHRLADGSLLVAGQRTTVEAIHGCGPQCPQPWVVARVEPRTGAVQELLSGPGTAALNYACGAVAVADTLCITARGEQRLAYRRVPAAMLR